MPLSYEYIICFLIKEMNNRQVLLLVLNIQFRYTMAALHTDPNNQSLV